MRHWPLWTGGGCNDTPEVVNGMLYAGTGAVSAYTSSPSPLARRQSAGG